MIEILIAPFVACLVLTAILCYFGIHVILRQVIFVDLALAQIAALGAAVGAWLAFDHDSPQAYACALGFTMLGAAIFTIGRFRDRRVPQEAVIGILYAVSTALTILILSRSAVEEHEIENILVGRLLLVEWSTVARTAGVCAVVGLIHLILHKRFFAISQSTNRDEEHAKHTYLWDFIFYATFGFVVTSSVQIAGVLLVFSFLIVPAACAMLFFKSVAARLLMGWLFGVIASLGGLAASAQWDLPTGAAVVAAFGALFLLNTIIHFFVARYHPSPASG